MYRYCIKCGCKCYENSKFCTSCGAEFVQNNNYTNPETNNNYNDFEQQVSDPYKKQSIGSTYYQPAGDPLTTCPGMPEKKKKPIIAAIAIATAAILIIAGLYVVFVGFENDKKNELDILIGSATSKVEGGPSASLQSLAGGSFQSIPEEGHVAKYYLYNDGSKIGETTEGTVGTEVYQGISCYKIIGRSNMDFSYAGQTIAFQTDYTYYVDVNTNNPVYMIMKYDYSKPEQLKGSEMTVSLSWDQDTGKITSTASVLGQSVTSTLTFPTEYWGMFSSVDDLYVGFSKEFDYTLSVSGAGTSLDADMVMNISVTGQEDVTVPSGTYENCYVLEMKQTQSSEYSYGIIDVNIKIWISEDGVVAQADASLSSAGMPIEITAKLEGYYTTA